MKNLLPAPDGRKYFLDNIRWIVIMMVVIFHVFFYYNNVGTAPTFTSRIPGMDSDGKYPITFASIFQYSVYQWFMMLLFVVSGICSYYSIKSKGRKIFIKERFQKLIIPSTLGIALFWWLNGYLLFDQYPVLNSIPVAARYFVYLFLGIGQFWFLHVLMFTSSILYILTGIDKRDRVRKFFTKMPHTVNVVVLIFLVLPIWGSSQILNVPSVEMYRFGVYTVAFLAGYYIFSCDNVLASVKKIGPTCLALGVFLTVMYIREYYGVYYFIQPVLGQPECILSAWMMILGILGCSQYCLNFRNDFTSYMSKASFGLYVTHVFPLILADKLLISVAPYVDVNMLYIISAVFGYGGGLVLYEWLKNIPVVNHILFGVKLDYDLISNPIRIKSRRQQLQQMFAPARH